MNKDQFAYLNTEIKSLEQECDLLKSQVERLSKQVEVAVKELTRIEEIVHGEFCGTQCHREHERITEALKQIEEMK